MNFRKLLAALMALMLTLTFALAEPAPGDTEAPGETTEETSEAPEETTEETGEAAQPESNTAAILYAMGFDADTWLSSANYRGLYAAIFILEAYQVEGYMLGEKMETGIPQIYMYKPAVEGADYVGMDLYFFDTETGEPQQMVSTVFDTATGIYSGFTDDCIEDPTVYLDQQVENGAYPGYIELTLEELQNGMLVLEMMLNEMTGEE